MGSTPASGSRRRLVTLLIAVTLLGITESMIGPYLVLFGTERLRLSVLEIGVFISLTAVSGMAASLWLGRRYDQRPGRWPAVLAASLAGTGYLSLLATPSYPLVLLIGVALLGAGSAVFPQLFALAKSHTDGAAVRTGGTPVLRSAWSLAWAIGPLAGSALVAGPGYSWLLMGTACGFCLVVVALLGLDARPPQVSAPVETAPDRPLTSQTVALSIAGFTLFHVAMFSGAVALPLYVTQVLHGSAGSVGLMFSVGAVAEIPAALALLLLPRRWDRSRVILAGMGLMVVYFALVTAFTGIVALVLVHIARGVAIAVVGALGISHMQDLLPAAPGRATTLFANAATAGSLVSGIAAGALSHALGYRAALLVCGVLSGVAWLLFLLARRRASAETEKCFPEPAPPR
ncbi:sugar efflux transporter [Nonomuraea candida]|uniref:sugar efflux transporter n=1 Tax=Nonomuraea candida TaxID=359159 RepID=UPI0005B86A34|nr:sugar efflux transporter [Nonomuraea candida]